MNTVIGLDEAAKDITVNDNIVPYGLISLRDDAEHLKHSTPNHEHQNNTRGNNHAETLAVSLLQTVDTRMKGKKRLAECSERNER